MEEEDIDEKREFTKTVTEEVRVDPSIWSMIFPALVLIIPLIGLGFVTYRREEIGYYMLLFIRKHEKSSERAPILAEPKSKTKNCL